MKSAFVVVVTCDPWDGSPAAAAIHQSWGEEYVQEYLGKKLPAGSPFEIASVTQVDVPAREILVAEVAVA